MQNSGVDSMKRIKIGDVVEVPTKRGLAYFQYTLKVPQYGALIRIFPGFYETRPMNLEELSKQKEQFVTFFPLQAAINRKIFAVVGNTEIPEFARDLPLFRTAGLSDRSGKVTAWWLWDGKKEWKIGQLTEQQRSLPILEVWNDTLLIERIEEEWTPETDSLQ